MLVKRYPILEKQDRTIGQVAELWGDSAELFPRGAIEIRHDSGFLEEMAEFGGFMAGFLQIIPPRL